MKFVLGDVCGNYLAQRERDRGDIWVLDGDLADSDGAHRFAGEHPNKYINCGIAEQSMVSVAAGLAKSYQRPWVFSFSAFLTYRALDQIRVSVALTHSPVTLVGSHAGGCCGRNGKSHQAPADIAVVSSLPNVETWAPCDGTSTTAAVEGILASMRPTYLRLPRGGVPDICNSGQLVETLRQGSDGCIVTAGLATHWACEAADMLLAKHSLRFQVIHVNRVFPLPYQELADSFEGHQALVCIEDHSAHTGLSAILRREFPDYHLHSLGWPENWDGGSGECLALRQSCGLDGPSLVGSLKASITN